MFHYWIAFRNTIDGIWFINKIYIYRNDLRYRYESRILNSQCRSTYKWFDVTNCCYNISLLGYRICSLKGHTQTTIKSCARGNVILWLQMKCKSIINSEMNSTWGTKTKCVFFIFFNVWNSPNINWLLKWVRLYNETKYQNNQFARHILNTISNQYEVRNEHITYILVKLIIAWFNNAHSLIWRS